MKEASKTFFLLSFYEEWQLYYSRLRYIGKLCLGVDGKKA